MTFTEATNINSAFLRLKDKSLAFKTSLLISRNVQKLETALKPFLDSVNAAQKKVAEFKKMQPDVDAVTKDMALQQFVSALNAEVEESGKESAGIEVTDLVPIPESALEKVEVSMAEIHLLVIQGLITVEGLET